MHSIGHILSVTNKSDFWEGYFIKLLQYRLWTYHAQAKRKVCLRSALCRKNSLSIFDIINVKQKKQLNSQNKWVVRTKTTNFPILIGQKIGWYLDNLKWNSSIHYVQSTDNLQRIYKRILIVQLESYMIFELLSVILYFTTVVIEQYVEIRKKKDKNSCSYGQMSFVI